MRDLEYSDRNVLVISDGRSGTEIHLLYRTPSTEEEIGYQNSLFRRKGRKVIANVSQTRVEYGLRILTGFRDGDFGISGKPISANPESPDYREDWKDLIRKTASDIVSVFAMTVFERTSVAGEIEKYAEDIEVEEDTLPLARS